MREDAADDLWTSHRTRLSAQIGDRLEVAVRAPDDKDLARDIVQL